MGNYKKSQQERALEDISKSQRNFFITGPGGTGKSYLINEIRKFENNVLVCAPTGVAANNVEGVTIHSAFKLPRKPLGPNDVKKIGLPKLIEEASIIIIDEISMVRLDVFSTIVQMIRAAEEKNHKAKRLIILGDFFQLPPVLKKEAKGRLTKLWKKDQKKWFCFNALEWEECQFKVIFLTENMRQRDDTNFEKHLNQLRIGDTRCINYFNSFSAPHVQNGITLCGFKKTAHEINKREIEKNTNSAKVYKAHIFGEYPNEMKMTEDTLELKVGMRVMSIINSKENNYFNGSIGTIIELGQDAVIVRFDNGVLAEVLTYTWKYEEEIEEIYDGHYRPPKTGEYTQIPLIYAYAITIHKSQGLTLEYANICPEIFEYGMLYVALGRCKTIKNIYLMNKIEKKHVMVSAEVKKFYEFLR